jgi:hypothetical protein
LFILSPRHHNASAIRLRFTLATPPHFRKKTLRFSAL